MSKTMKRDYSIKLPVFVGSWRIGGVTGVCFNVEKRPNWIRRWICEFLLGWEWVPMKVKR